MTTHTHREIESERKERFGKKEAMLFSIPFRSVSSSPSVSRGEDKNREERERKKEQRKEKREK